MAPPMAAVMTMARGEAIFALEHSSDRWNGALRILSDKSSKVLPGIAYSNPDIVQIKATKLINTAIPSGQSVKFSICQTTLEGVNLGSPMTEDGIRIITTKRPIMLKVEP